MDPNSTWSFIHPQRCLTAHQRYCFAMSLHNMTVCVINCCVGLGDIKMKLLIYTSYIAPSMDLFCNNHSRRNHQFETNLRPVTLIIESHCYNHCRITTITVASIFNQTCIGHRGGGRLCTGRC